MSIHKEGRKWRVKWKVAGRQHSRTFDKKANAITFDGDIKTRRQLGPLLTAQLAREGTTLLDYVQGPWRAHAVTLAQPTRDKYAWAIKNHLRELVDEPLLALDVVRLGEHQALMLDRGATPSTVREVFARLSGILQLALQQGYVAGNAARALTKVPADEHEDIAILAPVELERLIAGLTGRDRAITLLGGHLGLRPRELRLAPWEAFDGQTLAISRARTKKTAMRPRAIAVPLLTAHELKAWRIESGGRGDDPIIGAMSANALKLWARRHLPEGVRVTDLRHSHASACHYVRTFTQPSILRRLGHGVQVHHRHYAGVIDQIEVSGGARYESLDELIASARAELGFRVGSVSAGGAS
jgi:integrase